MKIKLALLCALFSTNSIAQLALPSTYVTPEYRLSGSLTSINASSAYARGYTGKNSVIGIIDSGIDTSSKEFTNKILFIRDFSGSGTPIDKVGHGTHVAGIAAANRDGLGVHGVAYDSKLIVAKVTDTGVINSTNLFNALSYVNSTGADVANMSLGWTLSQNYLNARQIGAGMYTTRFTNTGTLPISNVVNIPSWTTAMQGEMVLVVAAGNDSTKWSQGLAGLATLTDARGNLVFGGRVLIAGNYDTATNALSTSSNGAGHLCQTTVTGVMNTQYCGDKFKTWEFYLMAPGTNIVSTVPKTSGIPQRMDGNLQPTGLSSMTGTSMSAPVISGAVAIIHEMWPQMKGANIVRLLLVTANKNIPNYNLYVHGQGLLDLEKATRPVGPLGIPTTGRLAGPNLTTVRPLIYTGGSASTGGLSKLMMVDSFERDFYVKGKYLTAHITNQQFNLNQMLMTYDSRNPFVLFNNYSNRLSNGTDKNDINLYRDFTTIDGSSPMMVEFGHNEYIQNTKLRMTGGFFTEQNTWLGNSIGSFAGNGNNRNSITYFSSLGFEHDVGSTKFYGSYHMGMTSTNSSSENITNIGKIYSNSYMLGAENKFDYNTVGLMFYKPVTVHRAIADVVAPIGLDSDFNIIQHSKVNLAAEVKEVRLGFYHKYEYKKNVRTLAFIERRNNYRGQEGVGDTAIGFSISRRF